MKVPDEARPNLGVPGRHEVIPGIKLLGLKGVDFCARSHSVAEWSHIGSLGLQMANQFNSSLSTTFKLEITSHDKSFLETELGVRVSHVGNVMVHQH